MRVLLLGSGGREHALARALAADADVTDLHAAPGNPGIAQVANVHPVDLADLAAVTALAKATAPGLVVIGPEAPLVAGLADALRAAGIACFGPGGKAAMIEGSKSFAKEIMTAAGIPTAAARTCEGEQAAEDALAAFGPPFVVKADGLAAGKGVVVAETVEQAIEEQQIRLVHGGGGQPGPADDRGRRRPDRHVRPCGQGEAVEDRGGQQVPVAPRQAGHPRGVVPQAPHPEAGLGPGRTAGHAHLMPHGGAAARGGQVLAKHPQFPVGRADMPGEQVHQGGAGRLAARDDADGRATNRPAVHPEARGPQYPAPAVADTHSGGEHRAFHCHVIRGTHTHPRYNGSVPTRKYSCVSYDCHYR